MDKFECLTYSSIVGNDYISSLVLVSMGMSANDDTLGPAGYKTRNGLAEDGFTEYSATQDVTDGTIGT